MYLLTCGHIQHMYSWWWVGLSPETCRVKHLERLNYNCCILLELFHYKSVVVFLAWPITPSNFYRIFCHLRLTCVELVTLPHCALPFPMNTTVSSVHFIAARKPLYRRLRSNVGSYSDSTWAHLFRIPSNKKSSVTSMWETHSDLRRGKWY